MATAKQIAWRKRFGQIYGKKSKGKKSKGHHHKAPGTPKPHRRHKTMGKKKKGGWKGHVNRLIPKTWAGRAATVLFVANIGLKRVSGTNPICGTGKPWVYTTKTPVGYFVSGDLKGAAVSAMGRLVELDTYLMPVVIKVGASAYRQSGLPNPRLMGAQLA